ncbi:MAG: VOC family protein [Verrucomicrobia bacterium]|nr:VOC family protein [Verrucomicrobiota bacterium]
MVGNKSLKESASRAEGPVVFRVEHLGLPARDPVALKDWYVRVLGARVVYAPDQTPPAFFLALQDHVMFEVYAGASSLPQTSDNTLNGWRHVALRVESLVAAKAELEKRGLKITEEIKPAGGGGSVLFFRDLEGNLLHLVERTPDSVFR